jgi:hypothetical protein
MDDDFIVTVYVIIDETMAALGHRDHVLAQASDAEVLTVAVVAAKSFQNHLERALQVLTRLRYLSGALSTSRFNRRLQRLADWLRLILEAIGGLFAHGAVFLIDSMPVPVCKRARAGILRLLRREEGAVLRLAVAPHLHRRRGAGGLRPAPRRPARPDADPRADLRLAQGDCI